MQQLDDLGRGGFVRGGADAGEQIEASEPQLVGAGLSGSGEQCRRQRGGCGVIRPLQDVAQQDGQSDVGVVQGSDPSL
ncbi:hypothetical protein [Streptomyces pseudogriseolus]|uniref:hypothetical protein n=1 Tax=Streptomyces pseudogriseolus TaxID=36817 RepID=UPI003489DE60